MTGRTARSPAAIILLLWLNYSAVALLFGAELNAELERKGRPRASVTRNEPFRVAVASER